MIPNRFIDAIQSARGACTLIAVVMAAVIAGRTAQGMQDATTSQPQSSDTARATDDPSPEALRAAGLDPEPVVSDPLGVRLHPPLNARVKHNTVRNKPSVFLSDGDNTPPTWTLRVLRVVTVESNPSAAARMQKQIDKLKAAGGNAFTVSVLSNDRVTVAGRDAQLCYIEQAFKDGQTAVSGTLLVPAGGRNRLAFSVYTTPEDLNRVRSLMNNVFKTIALRDTSEVVAQLSERLRNGLDLLESLTTQRLKALTGQTMWTRIYRPDAASQQRGPIADGQEVGYSQVEIVEGPRGAVDFNKSPSNYNSAERESGLMVRIKGRVIGNRQRGIFYDSVAAYWMAWDQSEELWSVIGTHRQGQASKSEAETGVRLAPSVGQPDPVLQVFRAEASEPYQWNVPRVYLSQPIAWILGKVLPRDIEQPREYAWYHYNGREAEPKLTRRVDRWEPASDGSGHWILTTRLKPDGKPIVTRYDADGNFLRQTRPDGVIMEPASLEELRRLWRRKGLPLKTGS